MARGGPRQPANPAPVSNPGSGRRTDGGAGSKSQPLRVATGGAYGESKALTEQQQGAPLASGPTPPSGGTPAPSGGGGGPAPSGPGLFGPTARPTESIMAGANGAPDQPQLTSDELLRVMYQKRPSPYLARLLRG
jgi:hypothetical protein